MQDFPDSPISCEYSRSICQIQEWDCVGNLAKALVEVHLLRWIATYPVDKVIRSLNNRNNFQA